MNDEKINTTFISLGWGVQSFTLGAMAALGVISPVAAAVNSDTYFEREETYAFAARWTPWLVDHGVNVVTVRAKRRPEIDVGRLNGLGTPPLYTNGLRDGKRGKLRRSCTDRWKIRPMRTFIRGYLKSHNLKKSKNAAKSMIGFSLDEYQRIKPSGVRYIENVFPLIDLRMTRSDCEHWLIEHGLEVPPKSACYFCPFHSNAAWRSLSPNDFNLAVSVDKVVRNSRAGNGVTLFLHPARVPLDEVDMTTPQERGQLELFQEDECSGGCFL